MSGSNRSRRGITEEEVSQFRVALSDRVNRSTLRAVAKEVGMSPTGLREFIDDGCVPYAPTIEKLRTWYYAKSGVQSRPPEEIAAMLRSLFLRVPRPVAGVVNVLGAVHAEHLAAGIRPPEWIRAAEAAAVGMQMHAAIADPPTSFAQVDAALALVLPNLPAENRSRATRWWALEVLLPLFEEQGVKPPGWVSEVAAAAEAPKPDFR